jgi:glycine/D-amino acid oxidase-like deaminating enzyme
MRFLRAGYCAIHGPQRKRRGYCIAVELTLVCCFLVHWKIGSYQTKSFVAAFRTSSPPRRRLVPEKGNRIGSYYLQKQARLYFSQAELNSVPKEVGMASKNIVVIGGGIQGAAVAYYLSKLSKNDGNFHLNITVLEAVSIASAASGKGGGFMAKTWGAGTPTQALHEVAFDLYAEDLAPTLNCTSYRKLPVLSITPHSARGSRSLRSLSNSVQSVFPDWLDPDKIGNAQVMGTGVDTAQITPLEVTKKMIQAVHASVVYGRCTGIELEDDGNSSGIRKVTGVRYCIPNSEVDATHSSERLEILPADQIVVCAGPWSCSLVDWMYEKGGDRKSAEDQSSQLQLPMEGIKSTSIVFPSPMPSLSEGGSDLAATALFCGEDDRYNTHCTYLQLFTGSNPSYRNSHLALHPHFNIMQWRYIPVQMAQSIFAELVVPIMFPPANCVKMPSCTSARPTSDVSKPPCQPSKAWCQLVPWPIPCKVRMSWIARKPV